MLASMLLVSFPAAVLIVSTSPKFKLLLFSEAMQMHFYVPLSGVTGR